MPKGLSESREDGVLVVVDGSPLWPVPAAATPGDIWALACLTGSCDVRLRQGPGRVDAGGFLALAIDPMGTLRFDAAQAVIFRTPVLETLALPREVAPLDEVSMCVLHDVFFAGQRPWPHRLAALDLICHQLAAPPEKTTMDPSGSIVTACLEYMAQHLDDEISLATLVEITGISKTQVLDRFRREHGQSPMKALTHMRMEHACDLLAQTDMTISQIAASVSYPELAVFTRAFTRRIGKPPSAYRKDTHWLV